MMIEPIKDNKYTCKLPKEARNKFNFRITAIDQNYNESPFAYVQAQMPDVTPPLPPFLNSAIVISNKLKISWSPSASTDIKSYSLLAEQIGDSTAQWKVIATMLNNENDIEIELPSSSTYLSLIGTDSAGLKSTFSNLLMYEATSQKEVMQHIKSISGFYDSTMNSIQLRYETPEFMITPHYRVFLKIAASAWTPVPDSAGENRVSVPQVMAHQSYTFKVMWQDENGFYQDCSNELILTIP
jgi:hypothetical protein